jgi:fatty acid synthase
MYCIIEYDALFSGPSYALDTACSSSLLAMDQALQAIRSGQCDAAIVGGSSLCLNPSTTIQFQKLGMLSPDGACKSFDASGNVIVGLQHVFVLDYTE